jgi:hypothetical protein
MTSDNRPCGGRCMTPEERIRVLETFIEDIIDDAWRQFDVPPGCERWHECVNEWVNRARWLKIIDPAEETT